jgi:hypothetical protein
MHLGSIPYEQQSVQLVGQSLYASSICSLGVTSCVPVESALGAPVSLDTTYTWPCCPVPEEDRSGLHLHHVVWQTTAHHPFNDGGYFELLPSLLLGYSYIPSSGCTLWGSPDPEEDISGWHLPHGVWPETSHHKFVYAGHFSSLLSLSPGGSSVPLIGSNHGGTPFSSSPSSWHHGESSFFSSPVRINGAMGYSTWMLILWGLASSAILLSVTREVQNVSLLAATPLTVIRALPLTANSQLACLVPVRISQAVLHSPPLLPLGLVLQHLLPPPSMAAVPVFVIGHAHAIW